MAHISDCPDQLEMFEREALYSGSPSTRTKAQARLAEKNSKGLSAEFPGLDITVAYDYLATPVEYDSLDEAEQLEARREFTSHIWQFYHEYGRRFPWRETRDTWAVLLSEVMLQQTQTSRVLPKYEAFLDQWPTWKAMAASSLDDVLALWKGLGYPRRALALRKVAVASERWGWNLPGDYDTLLTLPGVGPSTAAAICSFCYGQPAIYLETNIRRVLLYHFFPGQEQVHDKRLRALLERLLEDIDDVRAWYYALMDYGVLLKYLIPNANRRSAHYARQSKYENSNRQIRGLLLLNFSERGALTRTQLLDNLSNFDVERVDACIDSLCADGFIEKVPGGTGPMSVPVPASISDGHAGYDGYASQDAGMSVAEAEPLFRIRKE